MKCLKCKFDNESDAKFCNKCGNKLEIACPKCGKANRLESLFYKECGQDLKKPNEPLDRDLSLDEKLDKIQRYLQKALTKKILAQRGKIEGERKQVTVMFCEIEKYSKIFESFDPEEAYGTMDEVYELLI